MIQPIRNELAEIAKQKVVGLDIETITEKQYLDESDPSAYKWKICPFEIGVYAPAIRKGLTIFVNPYYWRNLSREGEAMYFYGREKYKYSSGYVLTMEETREVFKGMQFNKIYGHNCIKFDFPHLANHEIKFKVKDIVDTYLDIGSALPLKYYTTLRKWHDERQKELFELMQEGEILVSNGIPQLTDKQKKYYYKFFTAKNNLRMTAEAVYCFIDNDPDFIEVHQAQADCVIEYEIYKYIRKRSGIRRDDGNWMTVLLDFFAKFKKTQDKAQHFERLINKYTKPVDSYTSNMVRGYLGG